MKCDDLININSKYGRKKEKEKRKGGKRNNKIANMILAGGVLFAIGFFAGQQDFFNQEKKNFISIDEAKTKVESFVSENLVQPGTEIKITEAKEEKGLYKIVVSIMEQEIESYISKDGKEFFPQAMNIDEIEQQAAEAEGKEQAAQAEVPKNQKPVIETFIMSYCPYGTQIQKGLLPVVDLLKDKIDFNFKFVDYAMHDKKEIDENLVQYCANKINPGKYYEYLDCFLISSDSDKCLSQVGLSKNQIDTCVKNADSEYGITKAYENKEGWNGNYPPFDLQKEDNEKYGVKGSPTLVVNGVEASSARDPQSLLATICNAFEEAPVECNQQLSSETPSPGFGEGTAVSGATAECGE